MNQIRNHDGGVGGRETIFSVRGRVRKGEGKGTALGFPTVNIPCPANIPSGIFAGEVWWRGRKYPAALYKNTTKEILEAHILDFSGNVYGEEIRITAFKKIRDTQQFADTDLLIAVISEDIKAITKLCLRG